MTETKYPNFVRERFQQLVQKTQTPMAAIEQQYDQIFEGSRQRAQSQFPSATAEELASFMHKFSVGKIWKELIMNPPQTDVELIYCGLEGLRKGKTSGKFFTNMFAMIQDKGIPTLMRMTARGSMSEVYRHLSLPHPGGMTRYKVNLGRFENQKDLIIDKRSEFKNPTSIAINYKTFNETLNIPEVAIDQINNYPSKKNVDGWVVQTDWRCIVGFISGDPRIWERKNVKGTYGGVCNIVDMTVDEEPTVDSSGNIIRPGMTAWTAPELLIYEDGSYCAFYGTISIDDKGKPTMNCFLIIPIIPIMPVPETEE